MTRMRCIKFNMKVLIMSENISRKLQGMREFAVQVDHYLPDSFILSIFICRQRCWNEIIYLPVHDVYCQNKRRTAGRPKFLPSLTVNFVALITVRTLRWNGKRQLIAFSRGGTAVKGKTMRVTHLCSFPGCWESRRFFPCILVGSYT